MRLRRRASRPAPPGDVDALGRRVDALETMIEGLQDAVYRQSVHHDKEVEELAARLEPEEIARALSADARRRGL